MDPNTSELYSALESGPYDEAGLTQLKRLLTVERRALRAKNDLPALELLIPALQQWAAAAGGGWLSASALGEAAEIAELELRNTARAEELRTQAIITGRTASGTPLPMPTAEHTQEVHTLDLEVAASPSMLPDADTDVLSAEIARAEAVLASDSSPDRVRELADLYAKRDGDGDRQNAAQLYCTLAEMLGNPAGVPVLERAIALIPDHAEAKALLMRYAVRPRRISSPKITLLGVTPRGVPQPPPPAAAGLNAPKAMGQGSSTAGYPPPPAAGVATTGEPITPQPLVAVAGTPPPSVAEPIAPHSPLTAAGQLEGAGKRAPRKTTPLPSLSPGLSGALVPKTAAGAALSNAAARISSRPPAARASSRPPGRRASTSPGYATAVSASALAADDRAIPIQTVAAESLPPLAVAAAALPQLSAAVAHEEAEAHESIAPVAVPELEPANDAVLDAAVEEEPDAPEVLQLHGIPQVKTVPPSVPEISSLSPAERSDATELQVSGIPKKTKRAILASGLAFSAVAALGIYLNMPSKEPAPTPSAAKVVAKPEVKPAAEPVVAPVEPAPAPKEEIAAAPSAETPSTEPAANAEKTGTPAPLAPPGPSHLPTLKLESAKLKGGKLNETQLTQALTKAEPKLLACYTQALEHKPKLKGRILYSFTIRPTGKATSVKRAGGTLKDESILQCSAKTLEAVRFPKPKKNTQVKLPIQYKRS